MKSDIILILDRSGSMSSIRDATIEGVNTFLTEQKKSGKPASFTLVQFDNEYEVVYDAMPLSDVPFLTAETFEPRGGTALFDAIGKTINNTKTRHKLLDEADRPDKTIMVIVTDGAENASLEFTSRENIFEIVNALTDGEGWDVIYLGANQDAIAVGMSLGVRGASSANYCADVFAVKNTFSNVSRSVACSRISREYATSFTREDRASNMGLSSTAGSVVVSPTGAEDSSTTSVTVSPPEDSSTIIIGAQDTPA